MSDEQDNDVDFAVIKPMIKSQKEENEEKLKPVSKLPKQLALDEVSIRPGKTRRALYGELRSKEKILQEEDHYDFPNHFIRGVSLALDIVFIFCIVKFMSFIFPMELKLVEYFLNKYDLQFNYGPIVMNKLIMLVSNFLGLIFGVVIPTAFYNRSLGKKIFGLRVTGDKSYRVSIAQAFRRELVFKPFGMICIFGFVLPFQDKKRRSFHDKMIGTFVIKD